MTAKSLGLIGGGRISRIILEGFKRAGKLPSEVVISDREGKALTKIKDILPEVKIAYDDNRQPARKDIVILAIPPAEISNVLNEIISCLKANSVLISFAPKFSLNKLLEGLNGFTRVRMIPNAPSIVNEGYNPLAFSAAFSESEKKELIRIFSILGKCPEVEEEKLEAYAVLTAMGPTYFWFQLSELQKIGRSFGLTSREVKEGVLKMASGVVKTLQESGLPEGEVMDLIPFKPLRKEEENIKNIYRERLESLFQKMTK